MLLVDLGGLASGAFEAGQIRTRGSATNSIFDLFRFFEQCACPRTPSRPSDANLDCAFVENALFYTDP